MTDQVPENDRRVRYLVTAPGGQAVFQIDFPLDDVDYIVVYKNGVAVSPADYTVDLTALTATLDTPAAENDVITIEGERPLRRINGYPLRGGLRSSLLNSDINAIFQSLQELRRDRNRSTTLNPAEPDNTQAGLPLYDPGRVLQWHASERKFANGPNGADIANAGPNAAAAAASAAEAGTARTGAETARDAAIAAAAGMKWRPSVKVATTANITLLGAQTIDGVSVVAGHRVLVKNQSAAAENGVYVAAAGVWARAVDADSWNELVSQVVAVEEGSVNADQVFICTVNAGGTIGVTAVSFTALIVPVILASQAEAESGVENTKTMTALRTAQAIAVLVPPLVNNWTYLASQSTTSGTSKDFTIPAGAKDIELFFVGVSTSGTSNLLVQLGDAGGIETSGYSGITQADGVSGSNYTSGFQAVVAPLAADNYHGIVGLSLVSAAAFLWVADINTARANVASNGAMRGSGSKALSQDLTTLRVTTAGGSDTFDAGALYCRWR